MSVTRSAIGRHLTRVVFWLAGTSALPVGLGQADDLVTLMDQRGQTVQRRGDVTDYNARELRMTLASGATSRVPAARVVGVETTRLPVHDAAERQFLAHDYAAALEKYREAYRQEQRSWVQRDAVARSVACLRQLGDVRQAATVYLALISQEPATRHATVIPLVWRPVEPTREFAAEATRWLADTQRPPAARLIAASWLLAGRERSAAIRALNGLRDQQAGDVGPLAAAQSWRTQVATATSDQITRWQQQVDRMPRALRSGPTFLIAQGWARQRQTDAAVLAYLKVAFSDSVNYDLAPISLAAAGRLLRQAGRNDEAKRIYSELVGAYPEAPAIDEAMAALRSLGSDVPRAD